MARREEFFRGSEFPRLLLLVGVALGGWLLVFAYFTYGQRRAQAPPPKPVASVPPLPQPDKAPELQGIRDRTFINLTDNAAFHLLFERTNATPPETLAREARREVVYSQLIENPKRYRGLPIHIEGTARRILVQDDISPKVVPGGRFYEIYVFTPDSQNHSTVLAVADLPKTMPIGDNINERISFDGYFFKLMAYRAGDGKGYAAPLLIGRLVHYYDTAGSPAEWELGSLKWPLIALAILSVYILVRTFFLRRFFERTAPKRVARGPSPVEEIAPEDLAAWVQSPAKEQGDDPLAKLHLAPGEEDRRDEPGDSA